jgi:amino acid transporter
LSGYFHWVSGATDNAIYPSLFLKYIAAYLHQEDLLSNNLIRFVFAIFITAILSFVNYTGLEIVGKLSIAVSIISMAPFLIMCILAIPKLDASRWLVMPAEGIAPDDDHSPGFFPDPVYGGIMWRPLLNMLFWNLNSFDVGASFAGEVRDPERVFPRAMFLSIVLVVLGYILPLGASLGAVDTYQGDWDAGYFTNVSVAIGGNWLGILTVFAAAISNIALYEAEMSGDAYQLLGMGERGMIPKVFTKRSRFGTPVNGIILNTLTICAMSVADFDALVEMLNFAYALSLQMEFAAFIKLRITQPDGKFALTSMVRWRT